VALAVTVLAGGCAVTAGPPARGWHDGRLFVATGDTTSVFYQLGGGYADVVSRYLHGYEVRAEPTGASIDNLQRVGNGDMDIAFTLEDAAGDAVAGQGKFAGHPAPIRALARLYESYVHVIVRTDVPAQTLADLRDKRVSTGPVGSSTETVALRLLDAAGLKAGSTVSTVALSLAESIVALRHGDINALVWLGELSTSDIVRLLASSSEFTLLPIAGLLGPLTAKYGPVYDAGTIPHASYNTAADVATIAIPVVLVVSSTMPNQLAFDLTRLLFEHRDDLTKVSNQATAIERSRASATDPVLLHPGAVRYYDST
jgi:TRAP transporter TAXI family solute receptor